MKIVHSNAERLAADRRRELGWIHQGKAALHWSDDDYRYHLRQQTGKDSAKDLTRAERAAMLRHMAACGWQHKPKTDRPFDQAAKIRWLWGKLAKIGALRDPSDQALLAWLAHTTGVQVSHPKFLPNALASNAIEGLKAWLKRAEAKLASQSKGGV
ncbi:regulatory protein GemA [Vandammella animalimorsus]|uniref:GemA protein n=1 Tax=Vandammella animalimorsus TaxID=2029117 RepID=A0A2A2AB01_9BURK|nr:regulatory protein GemA [Vandammella animalimorsus]PAT34932.1 GemA protein [Vandammella animalimorsus]